MKFLYAGREFDQETALYYNRARYYDAGLGRFITADPKGYDAGLNLYRYALNNPLKYRDPSGLDVYWGGYYDFRFWREIAQRLLQFSKQFHGRVNAKYNAKLGLGVGLGKLSTDVSVKASGPINSKTVKPVAEAGPLGVGAANAKNSKLSLSAGGSVLGTHISSDTTHAISGGHRVNIGPVSLSLNVSPQGIINFGASINARLSISEYSINFGSFGVSVQSN